jgi:hypothetical protein
MSSRTYFCCIYVIIILNNQRKLFGFFGKAEIKDNISYRIPLRGERGDWKGLRDWLWDISVLSRISAFAVSIHFNAPSIHFKESSFKPE